MNTRSAEVESILARLSDVLSTLLTSGENWQVVLHGGRGGDVRIEVKWTGQVLPQRASQPLQLLEE